jgi:hypothetical protein
VRLDTVDADAMNGAADRRFEFVAGLANATVLILGIPKVRVRRAASAVCLPGLQTSATDRSVMPRR